MAQERDLIPGQGLTWIADWSDETQVAPGERGICLDHDGREPDADLVVEFPNNRVFCCRPSDVRPDPRTVESDRRHNGK